METPSTNVALTLRKARMIINAGWTQTLSKRPDVAGMVVCEWSHPDATEHSVHDALWLASTDPFSVLEAEEFLREFLRPHFELAWFEDSKRLKAEVLQVLDRAIPRADRMVAA